MKTLFTSVFLFLMTVICHAQSSGVISGKILEKGSKASLPGATVRLNMGNRYTISDQTGNYEFLNVPAGNYEIEVIYMGYQPETQQVTVRAGENTAMDFTLDDASVTMDEVVIMGDRLRGQARALNQQKNKANITNIISSDQVGRFPDANIGDALRRVPGITMQNDQGEARNIIVRGLSPELNSVTLNGDRIPSAEGDNRRVQMDLIPSDMISSIEVNKTLTPDMDADAIGGSVNLITRASPNGQRISATLGGGYNPLHQTPIYTGAFVYGNRFANNKFGMVISGSYNNNQLGSEGLEGEWSKDDQGNAWLSREDVRRYNVQRVRRSIAGAFDYKIDDNHSLYANAMYNWRDDWENRFRVRTDVELADEDAGVAGGFVLDKISRETKGGLGNGRVKNARLEDQRVQNYSVGGDHLLGTSLDMDWGLSYSKASESRPNERYIAYEGEGEVSVEQVPTTNDRPIDLVFSRPDVGLSTLDAISENNDYTDESEFGAKLNFRIPLSVIDGQKGRLRFGGRLRLKDKKRNNEFYEYTPLNASLETLGEVPTMNWIGRFEPGNQYAPGLFASRYLLGGLQLQDASQFEKELDPSEFLAINYRAKERITAGYLRWDQDFNNEWSMIVGGRLEHTKVDYTGNVVEDEEELAGTRSLENDYTNILPSLAFKYVPREDLVFRAAITTSLARPNYYSLAPYVQSVADGDDSEVMAGNPNLKATYAWNFDLMAEKYFKSVGILSGGVYYKNLSNFIYTYSNRNYTAENFAQDFPGAINLIPEGETWRFIQDRNGEQVNVYGFEVAIQRQLDFLPGKFLKSFGIYANYTFTKSVAEGISDDEGNPRNDITLPQTAPHMFNGSLSWENQRFSARISANYTAAYIDEIGSEAFFDFYYDKQFFLDANASYRFGKYTRVFIEANNLTNQSLRYYQGVSSRPMQNEFYRPRYNLGVKFDL
ncbi:TonB-dependent receptor [Olivibacter sp. SDN3]|uniref:TonB-dependent receptor n=1 Tax=Olivibacter sp. SDN3 TaxID=2764720 RepID=UPI0016514AA6|nr:TonB-dependent receptor [Olivibacter sp. SDN3]QNL49860.1 TonB-dependent receptor [Olivibacter sp. SDN3]